MLMDNSLWLKIKNFERLMSGLIGSVEIILFVLLRGI